MPDVQPGPSPAPRPVPEPGPRAAPLPAPRPPTARTCGLRLVLAVAVLLGVALGPVAAAGAAPVLTGPPALTTPQDMTGPPVVPRGAWGWPLALTGSPPQVLRPFEAPAHRWSPGHRGVDLAAATGDPVLAPSDGVVVFSGWVVDRGVVSVAGPGGLRSTLEPVTGGPAVGTAVRRGDQVGVLAGAPGHCAPRTCLHWGVLDGPGSYRDPLALLRPPGPPVLLPLVPGPRAGAPAGLSRRP